MSNSESEGFDALYDELQKERMKTELDILKRISKQTRVEGPNTVKEDIEEKR